VNRYLVYTVHDQGRLHMSNWGEPSGPYWRYPRGDATPFDKCEADRWQQWASQPRHWSPPQPLPESGVEEL
jgi:hypothetical protein